MRLTAIQQGVDMSNLSGIRIILTGASEGIGRALALALASRGARLALAARDRERLESARAGMPRARRRSVARCPPTSPTQQDCEWLVDETVKAFGGIDVVVHNAGITMWSRFDALQDLTIFERVMEVNYLAPVRLTALSLPHLKQSKGLLVAVASLAGLTGVPERSGYAASKHAMIGFFDSLRIELARQRRRRERDRAGFRGQRDPQARDRPGRRAARRTRRWCSRRS